MTGCSADYCTNSSSKGYQMCRFPREAKRRKIWIENVSRADWVPGPSSTLCAVHFSDEMWEETTQKGKRRLKCTAIPTIFHDRLIVNTCVEESMNSVETQEYNISHTLQEAQEEITINERDVHNEILKEIQTETEEKELSKFKESSVSKNNASPTLQLKDRLSRLEKLYEKSEKSRIALKKILLQPRNG